MTRKLERRHFFSTRCVCVYPSVNFVLLLAGFTDKALVVV